MVAAEVRCLAQRSAGAAREIKTLIVSSIEAVQQGAAQVGQAGDTMKSMVTAIRQVTDIMGDITSQSQAQADQIRQFSAAVREVDNSTQSNAAMVEENLRVADSLDERAAALQSLAGRFKT